MDRKRVEGQPEEARRQRERERERRELVADTGMRLWSP